MKRLTLLTKKFWIISQGNQCHRVKSVRNFLRLDWIWKDTPYLSVFSPNAGNCGPEKLRIWTLHTLPNKKGIACLLGYIEESLAFAICMIILSNLLWEIKFSNLFWEKRYSIELLGEVKKSIIKMLSGL